MNFPRLKCLCKIPAQNEGRTKLIFGKLQQVKPRPAARMALLVPRPACSRLFFSSATPGSLDVWGPIPPYWKLPPPPVPEALTAKMHLRIQMHMVL